MMMKRWASSNDKVPSTKRASRAASQPDRLASIIRTFHVFGGKGFPDYKTGFKIHHAKKTDLGVRCMDRFKNRACLYHAVRMWSCNGLK